MPKEKEEIVKDVLSRAMQRRLSSRGAAADQPDYASLHSGRPPRLRLSEGEDPEGPGSGGLLPETNEFLRNIDAARAGLGVPAVAASSV
jgi:hypothetical protein